MIARVERLENGNLLATLPVRFKVQDRTVGNDLSGPKGAVVEIKPGVYVAAPAPDLLKRLTTPIKLDPEP